MFYSCPLCLSPNQNFAFKGEFTHCLVCDLIFRAPKASFTGLGEKKHYLLHQNGPQHDGYVSFLKRAIDPIETHLLPNLQALDFGCGPGPAINYILQSYQISCDNYDPFFFPEGIKEKSYDFIFATECVEHFFHPNQEFEKILGLLKVGGYLSMMTEIHPGLNKINDWYYIKDATHVSLYSEKTFMWIALKYKLKLEYTDQKRVVVFRKTG
ncbi:methyltransferase domain-containing protein [Belliella aquatica]|uniref:Methyltransferase n=1 Tax=Belliella aquatica TaxID=1323734 RepID=A0ABQ1MUN4_9BACT|nr:methyltransferase domain-containing protein [Belliella aquatica]MCH7406019.1 class I SAM-dependent methyltransferase [Belliella aquatica]GGC43333.1 methyltransferase [Belliella aquatica]